MRTVPEDIWDRSVVVSLFIVAIEVTWKFSKNSEKEVNRAAASIGSRRKKSVGLLDEKWEIEAGKRIEENCYEPL